MVGKWHLGHPTVSHWPTHRGFDSFYGFLSSAVDYWNKTSMMGDGWLDLQDGVDLVTDAAELAEHAGLLFSRKVMFFFFFRPALFFCFFCTANGCVICVITACTRAHPCNVYRYMLRLVTAAIMSSGGRGDGAPQHALL